MGLSNCTKLQPTFGPVFKARLPRPGRSSSPEAGRRLLLERACGSQHDTFVAWGGTDPPSLLAAARKWSQIRAARGLTCQPRSIAEQQLHDASNVLQAASQQANGFKNLWVQAEGLRRAAEQQWAHSKGLCMTLAAKLPLLDSWQHCQQEQQRQGNVVPGLIVYDDPQLRMLTMEESQLAQQEELWGASSA